MIVTKRSTYISYLNLIPWMKLFRFKMSIHKIMLVMIRR